MSNRRPPPFRHPYPKFKEIARRSKIVQFCQFLAWLTKICALYLVQCQVQRKDWLTITALPWIRILKERYGFLDGLDAPMDGLDILLFINSVDIFSEIISVLLSLLQLREWCLSLLNVSYPLNASAWTPKVKFMPRASVRSLAVSSEIIWSRLVL